MIVEEISKEDLPTDLIDILENTDWIGSKNILRYPKFCILCGEKIKYNNKYCPNCGRKIEDRYNVN